MYFKNQFIPLKENKNKIKGSYLQTSIIQIQHQLF